MGKSIIDTSSVTRVGLDLAKRVFRIHAVDAAGFVVIARSINRRTLLKFFDELPRCAVAMEACSSAHHWGRQLLELGFAVRELCGKVGDGVNQAADLISVPVSIPSLNFRPLTTFGNWF